MSDNGVIRAGIVSEVTFGPNSASGHITIPVALDADWVAVYHFDVSPPGAPTLCGLRVTPRPADLGALINSYEQTAAPPGTGLTARTLRRLTPGSALEAARENLLALVTQNGDWLAENFPDANLGNFEQPKRPGRKGHPDAYYARVAATYVQALAGGSRKPVADTATQLGDGWTTAHVRDLIFKARRRGLLTEPAAKGRPGGELTEKAKAALTEPPAEPVGR